MQATSHTELPASSISKPVSQIGWTASDEARLQRSREIVAVWTGLLNKSLAGVPLSGGPIARTQYRKLIRREEQIIAVMEARKETV